MKHLLGERKRKGAEKCVKSFSFYAEKHLFAKKKRFTGNRSGGWHGFIFSIMPVFLIQSKVLFPGMEGGVINENCLNCRGSVKKIMSPN
jgi:hypothetical protein